MSRVFSSPTPHQATFSKPAFSLVVRTCECCWFWFGFQALLPGAFLARKKHPMWLMVEIQTNKAKQAMSREKFELDNLLYDEIVWRIGSGLLRLLWFCFSASCEQQSSYAVPHSCFDEDRASRKRSFCSRWMESLLLNDSMVWSRLNRVMNRCSEDHAVTSALDLDLIDPVRNFGKPCTLFLAQPHSPRPLHHFSPLDPAARSIPLLTTPPSATASSKCLETIKKGFYFLEISGLYLHPFLGRSLFHSLALFVHVSLGAIALPP